MSGDEAYHLNYYCLLSTKGSLPTWPQEFALVLKREMGNQRGLSKCTLADQYVSRDESWHSCTSSSDGVVIISVLFLVYVMVFQQLQLHFEDSFLIWKLFSHLGPLLLNLYIRLLRAEIN